MRWTSGCPCFRSTRLARGEQICDDSPVRRWFAAVVLTVALFVPGGARADLLVGVELHAPWTLSVRVEWQPWELLIPSLSLGFAPGGMVSSLNGGDALAGTVAFAARLTTIPLPLLGLSFNLGVRTFNGGGVSAAGLEIGIGWRLGLGPLEGFAELGGIFTGPVGGPYLGLGLLWVL